MISKANTKFLKEFNDSLFTSFNSEKVNFNEILNKINDGTIKIYSNKNEVINYKFIDEISKVSEEIGRIISKPLISVKYNDEIIRVEEASLIDEDSIRETIKDTSLWTYKNEEARPKETHTKFILEDYAIYENRFIKLLIDQIESLVYYYKTNLFNKISTLASYFNTLELGFTKYSVFNNIKLNYIQNRALLDKGNSKYYENYTKTLQILNKIRSFKSSRLYKECSKLPDINRNINLTNIIMKNYSYNYCYKYYVNSLYKDKDDTEELYFNYALIRFFSALFNNHFKFLNKKDELILSIDNGSLSFNKVNLVKNGVLVSLKKLNKNSLEMEVTLDFKHFNFKKHKDLKNRRTNLINLIFLPSLEKSILEEDNDTYYVLFTNSGINSKHVILLNNKIDEDITLNNFINTLAFLISGSYEIYSTKCPICGSDEVSEESGEFICSHCGAIYSLLENKKKEYVYIKHFNE